MAFKLSLVADVRDWLKGTADVEKSLDDLADGLDDLARDTKQNADQAADVLEREFSSAFDKVKKESKDAGRKLGDNLKDGTRKAEDGFDDLKDEANQSAREAAASFSGEFDDVADYVQEVLAQALSGFGPVGAAAGLAAAAGIGILVSGLQNAADEAEDAKERILELAGSLREVNGNPALLDWAERIAAKMDEIIDKKEWWELWQASPTSYWEDLKAGADAYGLTLAQVRDVSRGLAGDQEAGARALDLYTEMLDEAVRTGQTWVDTEGNVHNSNQKIIDDLNRRRSVLQQANAEGAQAADIAKFSSDVLDENAEATKNNADAQQARVDALEAAKRSNESFRESVKGLDDDLLANKKNWNKNKIDIDAWTKDIAKTKKRQKVIVDFDVSLSPEAREQYRKLDPATQYQLARQGKKSKKVKEKIEVNLEATAGDVEVKGKPKPVKVPTEVEQPNLTAIEPTGTPAPITLPTEVDNAGALEGAQSAADAAQKIADRDGNKIEYRTKVKASGLQAEVNRIARSINPPTVYVNVKAKKEVP